MAHWKAEHEDKLNTIISEFWSKDNAIRMKSIQLNYVFIIEQIENVIAAKKEDFIAQRVQESEGFVASPSMGVILELNLHQINSILCDNFHFIADGCFFTNIKINGDKDSERLINKRKAIESALLGIEGTGAVRLIGNIINRYYTDEDLTVNKLIIELCKLNSRDDVIWSEWLKKFESVYPHGANYIIKPDAMIALIGSDFKAEILTLLFLMDASYFIFDPKKIALNSTFKMPDRRVGIWDTLEALSNISYHPYSCDAFLSWIRLRCLYGNFRDNIGVIETNWKFKPEYAGVSITAEYSDLCFKYFLLSVPRPDRAGLKRLIASNFLLFNLIERAELENGRFIRNIERLEVYQKKFKFRGNNCKYGLIMYLIEWKRLEREWTQLIEENVIDQNYIYNAPFPTYWIRSFFTILDYDLSDVDNSFFTRHLFWDERPINWN